MKTVLKPGIILMCLAVVLTGCSSRPHRGQESGARVWLSTPTPTRASDTTARPRSTTLPTPQPAPRSYADSWIPLSRWSREHHAGLVWPLAETPSPSFALTTTNGVLVVRVNSLVAKWNGVEVYLGFKPQLIGGEPYVHVLDLEKNIEPLIRGFSLPQSTNRVVVIDPGHGGQNTGTRSVLDGVNEKEYTLDWARRLEPLLATNGWQVFLTRTDDEDMDLSTRVAFATDHHADLFLSLHFNSAAPSQEQSGIESYCLTPAGMPSTLTRGYTDDTSLVYPNNRFDAQSLDYAFRLQRSLLRVVVKDRGVRRARFLSVLRGQQCPAVLIEGGFMSNPREARLIADPAYRQKLAEAVADVLNGTPETGTHKSEVADQAPALAPLTAVGGSPSNAPASTPELP